MTDTQPSAPKITLDDLVERLRSKYPAPEWIVLREVRNGTGFQRQTRSADVMAMSTYPSRGCQMIGFELKVSRSDVVKELKSPDKAVDLQDRCDLWYLVVSDAKLVSPDEVPATWGLMVPSGKGLRIAKPAAPLEAKKWDRPFMASLLRNAVSGSATDKQLADARADGIKYAQGQNTWELEQTKRRLSEVERIVQAFEENSGERLDRWAGHTGYAARLGARVRAARDLDLEEMLKNTDGVRGHLARVMAELDAAVEKCRAAQAPPCDPRDPHVCVCHCGIDVKDHSVTGSCTSPVAMCCDKIPPSGFPLAEEAPDVSHGA